MFVAVDKKKGMESWGLGLHCVVCLGGGGQGLGFGIGLGARQDIVRVVG